MAILRELERSFRHLVVYPTLRRVLNNREVPLPLDLGSIRRLLLLRTDRLGDMVVTSSFIHRIRERAPSISLGMVVSHRNLAAARLVDGIDALYVIGGGLGETVRSIRQARSARYDVVLNLVFNQTTLGGIISNLVVPGGTKVGQGDEKYRFYFNAMLKLERGRSHMAEVLRSVGVQTFGPSFYTESLPYALHDEPASAERVDSLIARLGGPPVVINLSAGHPGRSLSSRQAVDLAQVVLSRLQAPVVLSAVPQDASNRQAVLAQIKDDRVLAFPDKGSASFADIVALVRRSRLVVTPDTSFVHIAGATGTPLLALFVDPFAFAEWHPRNTESEVVMGDPGTTVSSIPSARIVDALDRLIGRMGR